MVSYRVLLICLCFLFISNLEATNILNTTEHKYYTGLLIQTEDGGKDLIVGNALLSHEWLLAGYIMKHRNIKITKLLWAGELESLEGKVINVNETAGILNTSTLTGIDKKDAGVDNLESYINSQVEIKNKYFANTKYIHYSEENKHLTEALTNVSYLRHNILGPLGSFFSNLEQVDKEADDVASMIKTQESNKEVARKIFTHYTNAMEIVPELNTPQWRVFKPYLEEAMALGMYINKWEFERAYGAFKRSFLSLLNGDSRENNVYDQTTIVKPEIFDEQAPKDEKIKVSFPESSDITQTTLREDLPALFKSHADRPAVSSVIEIFRNYGLLPKNGVLNVIQPGANPLTWALALMVRPDIKIIISEGDNLSFSGNHSLVWSDMEKYNKEIIETSEFKDKESFEQQIRERVVFHYMGDVFPDVKSDMILSVAPYAELGGYLDEHMKPEGVAWIVAYEPLLYNFLSRKGTENLSIITEYPRLMQTNNYTDFSVREKTIDSRYNIIMINGPVGSFMPKSSEQFMPEKGKLLNVNPTFTDVGYLIWNKNADEIIERNRSNMVDLNDPEKMINKIKQSDKPVDQTVSEEPALFADEKIESLIDLAIKTPEKDKETVYVSMVESIIQARDEIGKPIDSKLNSYYLKAKMNDLGRAKDHKLYKQRAMEAFNSIDPDVILGKLIEQRGKLISQEQFDFFTGSQERIYEDSYFNQGKDRPSTNSMVLSILLVLSVNESARIEGGLEPLLNHVVKYGKPVLIDRLMSYSDNSQKYSKERQNLFFKIEDKVRLGIEKAEREIKGFK